MIFRSKSFLKLVVQGALAFSLLAGCQSGLNPFRTLGLGSSGSEGDGPHGLVALPSATGDTEGFIYAIYDNQVFGCAWDPDNMDAKIQVHAFAEGAGVISVAENDCPWKPEFNGHGFWIQFLHPMDSINGRVDVAAINSSDTRGSTTWLKTEGVPRLNVLNRGAQTFLYENSDYKVGINLRGGASLSEFYNKRVNPDVNLVTSDPGSAIQVALFGDTDHLPFLGASCRGDIAGLKIWNPTQAGTGCFDGSGTPVYSDVDMCESSRPEWCGTVRPAPELQSSGNDWIQWRVHFRNFYYSSEGFYPYQSFDDVYGTVRYTFKQDHLQVDHQTWRTSDLRYGVKFQQMPVAFLTQFTEIASAHTGPMVRTNSETVGLADYQPVNTIFPNSRWIEVRSTPVGFGPPVMSPGNRLTFGFYSSLQGSSYGKVCPERHFEMQFNSASGSAQHGSVIQNYLVFEPRPNEYMLNQTVIYPYGSQEQLRDGQTPASKIDKPTSEGGDRPLDIDC